MSGVDPYTAQVANFVASRFRIGSQGALRVKNALSQLPCLCGYGDVLWFGVGIQSLVRLMSKTDQGCIWVALSAALAECYHEEIAAEILHEMVLTLQPPQNLIPSVMEFLALVKACQSSLKLSNFGIRAETLMSLCKRGGRNSPNTRGRSAPPELAAAIMALGKVGWFFSLHSSTLLAWRHIARNTIIVPKSTKTNAAEVIA